MSFKPAKLKLNIPMASSFTPTDEQIENARLVKTGKNVKIIAGPGTGKSSSLRYIAEQVPDKNILVLCFNAANAKESNAHPDKPDNIFYATIHSIAYAKEMASPKMKKKLSFLSFNDLKGFALETFIDRPDIVKVTRSIITCINYFCRSDKSHLSSFAENYFNYLTTMEALEDKCTLSESQQERLVKITEQYWENLISLEHPATISHDIYLKLFQLAAEKIYTIYDKNGKCQVKIDILALDEAQDTNPVSEIIFASQTHLQRIIVGDPMQQLYAWRGAGKTMDNFNDFEIGNLCTSFRFNQTIADNANRILALAGSKMILQGKGTKTKIDTKAWLCRTNASVIQVILANLSSKEKIYTSINFQDVFSKLYHLQACYFNTEPKFPNKELAYITDRKTLEAAQEYSDEVKRLVKLNLSLTSLGTLTQAKTALQAILVNSPKDATLVVSTIHAAKGLEYSSVTIDDDFLSFEDEEDSSFEEEYITELLTEEKLCLLFVALTRAEVEVNVPSYLREILL
jgi:superfamily I DNA/RNA helicase